MNIERAEAFRMATQDDGDYIADNYGTCSLGAQCQCLRDKKWLGRACDNWEPTPARTWKQLRSLAIQYIGEPWPSSLLYRTVGLKEWSQYE